MLRLPNNEASWWRSAYPKKSPYSPLRATLDVNAVVIGAGITGLSAAYLLARAGKTVAVVDKNTVGGGTSTRTTGKVTSQHNLTYAQFEKEHGSRKAALYGQANEAAIELIEHIVTTENINCEWQRCHNYIFTTQKKIIPKLREETEVSARLGLPATFEQNTPLPFGTQASVRFSKQAKIHMQKYLLGLASAITSRGGSIYEHSPVRRINYRSGYITTPNGRINAEHIIIATNVPTLPLVARGAYCFMEYPTESYAVSVILTKPLEGMYISPDKDHYSILPTTINNKPAALVVGAGGNLAGFRLNKQKRYEALARYAQNYLGATEVTHAWSDRDYISYDGIPLIGDLYPWSQNIYLGTAYKKWGLTNGTVAAMLVSDKILGNENQWTDTFKSMRISPILHMPKTLFKHMTSS